MQPTSLFSQLNPAQLEAVQTITGPLLVIAGAGSGKTRVVTLRIINLIMQGISPSSILGLTFTNKAAEEMKERVRSLTQHNLLICTFHSLGARILRESIEALGYQRSFNIYDEEDVDKVIKTCMLDVGVAGAQAEPKTYRQMISKAKNQLQSPENSHDPFFAKIFACYTEKMKEYNALDFDDLLFLPVRLFREHPDILAHYQNRWQFFLIDEYQDTNPAQYDLVQHLVARERNLCVVGDPDQSIYSWRGADIRNILNFEKDYPGAKVVRLEQNYRSRTNILEAANAIINKNKGRYEKHLWSDRGAGERLKHYAADTEKGEAAFIAERIRHHRDNDQIPLNEMVIFYRTNAQSRAFEDCLLQHRIPFVIVGGISFYQRREIKDILAYLRMVQSGNDFVSFLRTIHIPKRGFGETTIERMRQAATQSNLSIFSYCEALADEAHVSVGVKLNAKQKEGLRQYVAIIRTLKEIQSTCSLAKLVEKAIVETDYLEHLKEDPESAEDRKENLDSLIAKAIEWEMARETPHLSDFLEELSLRSSLDEADPNKEHVHLMTIHNGKGLEFAITFLAGLEEELFPHINVRKENEKDGIEEERRLFYVGMTRAKEVLYLTEVHTRFIWGQQRSQRTSRFLREIPFEYIEKMRRPYQRPEPYRVAPRVIEEEPFADEQETSKTFTPGDAVFHKEFGTGIIRDIYEGSLGLTYKILFSNDNREKSIVAKYASLMRL